MLKRNCLHTYRNTRSRRVYWLQSNKYATHIAPIALFGAGVKGSKSSPHTSVLSLTKSNAQSVVMAPAYRLEDDCVSRAFPPLRVLGVSSLSLDPPRPLFVVERTEVAVSTR